jgi:hypothetical protein
MVFFSTWSLEIDVHKASLLGNFEFQPVSLTESTAFENNAALVRLYVKQCLLTRHRNMPCSLSVNGVLLTYQLSGL